MRAKIIIPMHILHKTMKDARDFYERRLIHKENKIHGIYLTIIEC